MMQRFFIDRSYIELGLKASELVCLAALHALCLGDSKSWKGSYREPADESGCGNKDTAQRAVEVLIQRGLVKLEDGVFSMTHIETDKAQNETAMTQNETNSKEKSTKKENNIKDITKDNKSESNSTLALYKTILENGYLHPRVHLKNMTSYYDANGWKSDNKAAVLNNWMRREQQYGHKPQMSDQAAAFICDMVDALPDYQESFCDALEAVKIEGNRAVLYVPEARKENLLNWLRTVDLNSLLARHRMKIRVDAAA